jgi:hypothetical protein
MTVAMAPSMAVARGHGKRKTLTLVPSLARS